MCSASCSTASVVVGLVDDLDRDAQAGQLADAAAVREGHDADVVALAVHPPEEAVQVLLGAAVGAGRQDLEHADPRRARLLEPADRLAAGIVGGGDRHRASRPSRPGRVAGPRHEDPLDRLVDRAPLVLVRLVAAQEVEPATTGRDGRLHELCDHEHARREVARVRIDARRCSSPACRRLEVDRRADAPAIARRGSSAGPARRVRTPRTAVG